MAGTARRGCALPRERCADGPGPGSGGVRPAGGQRQLRVARRAAGGRAARVGAMIRRVLPWLMLAAASGMVACAEWAGSALGGLRLSIVPLLGIGSGTVLLDDLDQLHVVVMPISSVAALPGAVVDTTVPVDAAGDATLTVPIVVIGRAQPFQVTLEGIRSSDGAVLYAGVDTVVVSGAGANPPRSVAVSYIGPGPVRSGWHLTRAPPKFTPPARGGVVGWGDGGFAPAPPPGRPR